jgi:malate permease and related proteins
MAVLERIIGIILPVFIIVGAGYGYARLRGDSVRADMTAVNRVSMEVLCPLLIFTALAGKEFNLAANGVLILAGVAIALGSGLLAWPVARMLGYDVRSFVPPMMYNNCGNMGLPLALLAFGSAGLTAMIALFMACTLVYFSVGIKIIESGGGRAHASFFSFLASPMMIAMIVGIVFSLAGISVPLPLFSALKMLGRHVYRSCSLRWAYA